MAAVSRSRNPDSCRTRQSIGVEEYTPARPSWECKPIAEARAGYKSNIASRTSFESSENNVDIVTSIGLPANRSVVGRTELAEVAPNLYARLFVLMIRDRARVVAPFIAAVLVSASTVPAIGQPARTHVIQRGETLYRIARQYGVRVDHLMRENRIIDPSQVRAGAVLSIPTPGGPAVARPAPFRTAADVVLHAAAAPVVSGALPSDAWDTAPVHVVRPGDNLYRIAIRYGVTVRDLQVTNGLPDDGLVIGQALRLPPGAPRDAGPEPMTPPVPPDPTVPTPGFRTAVRAAVPGEISMDRQSVVLDALGLIGTPYRWGGADRAVGLDCSGFITVLFAKRVPMPRTSYQQWRTGAPVRPEDWVAGDLIFFNADGTGASHVGMLIGGDKFIHSSSAGRGVIISSFNEPFYRRTFLGARRLLQ